MNKNNIKLHLYLWLDWRQSYKRDAQASTSQREQYGGIVHLFIGTGHSLCGFTFMPFINSYSHDTDYHGLIGLFTFKSVLPFISKRVIMSKLPRW
jgi:Na+/melibiose symporter-like transporter